MHRRALVFLAALACGCSGAAMADGGVDAAVRDAGGRDAGEDAAPQDAGSDAGNDAGSDAGNDAGSDAGPPLCTSDDDCEAPTPACDVASGACVECTSAAYCSAPLCDLASHECAVSTVLLAALTGTSVRVASYREGAWTTAVADRPDGSCSHCGGGLAVTGIDRGILVLRGVSTEFLSAEWSGTWGSLERQGTVTPNLISAPYAVAGGALVAHETATTTYPLQFARYEDGAGWTALGEPTGLSSSNAIPPAVVTDRSGVALVIIPPDSAEEYRWTRNAGGTWTAPADIPNTSTNDPFLSRPWATAVRRAGTDEIVAAFHSGNTDLRVATFAGGVWSSAVTLASDVTKSAGIGPASQFSMVALRDARVALAYVDSAHNVRLAFFDGTAWSAFTTVPLPTTVAGLEPIALAPGSDASVALELAYIDSSKHVNHTRLDVDGVTWSTPVTVTDELDFDVVYLAADPAL